MELGDRPETPRRETLLTVMLTGLGAGAFLLFLIFVSGGFFFWVVLSVAAMVGLGYFHYVLWGHAMTEEIAEQRAQAAEEPLPALNDARRGKHPENR